MTHSFHCCAFKYPSRHDPLRHAERMLEITKWQQECKKSENENKHAGDELLPPGQQVGANGETILNDWQDAGKELYDEGVFYR